MNPADPADPANPCAVTALVGLSLLCPCLRYILPGGSKRGGRRGVQQALAVLAKFVRTARPRRVEMMLRAWCLRIRRQQTPLEGATKFCMH